MKKFFVISLMLVYGVSSSGMTLHMHYCMSKLADWGLVHNDSKKCSKCGMETKDKKGNGCCKDEHKFLKDDTDQKTNESVFKETLSITISSPASPVEISFNDFTSTAEENPVCNAPPRSSEIAVYLRNCVFLI